VRTITAGAGAPVRATHILDDDPTGTQCVESATVVLWPAAASGGRAIPAPPAAVYHLTNSRALTPTQAGARVKSVAGHILAAQPSARIVLRGDSTLRGHVFEEYEALAGMAFPAPPVLLLVPAMPAAGRITVDGVHLVDDRGERRPVASTPYAADPRLGYRCSHLLEWAEERSGGALAARSGRVVGLRDLRETGGSALTQSLIDRSRAARPVVCAVDAETHEDLALIAAGFQTAEAAGANVLVRSAPPLAAVLGECLAGSFRPPPRSEKVLVVCGSFVPLATRQLAALCGGDSGSILEADLKALVADPQVEQQRLAKMIDDRLAKSRVAVLATPRAAPTRDVSYAESLEVGESLAAVLPLVAKLPSVVISKGGVTSATVAAVGLGAETARVEGPSLPGVATWQVGHGRGATRLLVVPGNVGSDDLLAELVAAVLSGAPDGIL